MGFLFVRTPGEVFITWEKCEGGGDATHQTGKEKEGMNFNGETGQGGKKVVSSSQPKRHRTRYGKKKKRESKGFGLGPRGGRKIYNNKQR